MNNTENKAQAHCMNYTKLSGWHGCWLMRPKGRGRGNVELFEVARWMPRPSATSMRGRQPTSLGGLADLP